MGSVTPIESVTVKANYNLFWNQYLWNQDTATYDHGQESGGFIGQEVDINVNWDYTEDVSFNVLAGWFIPGTVYYGGGDNIAKIGYT